MTAEQITNIAINILELALVLWWFYEYKKLQKTNKNVEFIKNRILEIREDIDEINNTVHELQRKLDEK